MSVTGKLKMLDAGNAGISPATATPAPDGVTRDASVTMGRATPLLAKPKRWVFSFVAA